MGLFNSEVKTHLLLFANKGSEDYAELKERLGALAPEFTGEVRTHTNAKSQVDLDLFGGASRLEFHKIKDLGLENSKASYFILQFIVLNFL